MQASYETSASMFVQFNGSDPPHGLRPSTAIVRLPRLAGTTYAGNPGRTIPGLGLSSNFRSPSLKALRPLTRTSNAQRVAPAEPSSKTLISCKINLDGLLVRLKRNSNLPSFAVVDCA